MPGDCPAAVGREGYVLPYYRRYRDDLGNQQLLVSESFSSTRLPDLFNLDLRVARDFALAQGIGMNLSLDLFNATNERTVLWRDNRLRSADGNASNSNHIEQLQSPRVWRAGVRVRF